MKLFEQKILYIAFVILFVSSCQTNQNEIIEAEVNEISISENELFEEYLADQWDKDLEDRPIFASLLGDKRFNQDITPNNLEYYQKRISKLQERKQELNAFNFSELNSENKLNYKLLNLNLDNSLEASRYPSYYMSLNQRGGVQSYYETGDRLVYSSKTDYEDWLIRLSKYSDNINNTTNNLKEGLAKGYTQPKLVTEQVITQIDNLLSNDLDSHPYLKIFLSANDEYFMNDEKNQLIQDAKELIINKIIPAYQELNIFLKNDYLPKSRDSIG